MIRAIVIEDEKASRDTLIAYINKYCNGITIVAEAVDVNSAVAAINKHKPDLVYLDIEMPFGNGFDVLEQVDEVNFEIIFVTAFSNYAIKAFNSSAAHYLLKPVDIEELTQASQNVLENIETKKERLHTKVLMENIQAENKQLTKLVLPTLDGFEIVKVKDIIRCKAADNYTEIFMEDGKKFLISKTLKFYSDILEDMDFIRVHKSHLINMQYVKKYTKGKGGFVTMMDGSEVDVSSTKKESFLQYFR